MIIGVGGAPGTGKSTFSMKLCRMFNLPHKIATGFIREVVLDTTGNSRLKTFSYDLQQPNSGYSYLLEQAEILKSPINACIERAYREGTGLVLEGTHILPWVINNPHMVFTIMLFVSDEEKHKEMIYGDTHSRRTVSDDEFRNVRRMQDEIIRLSREHNIQTLEVSK